MRTGTRIAGVSVLAVLTLAAAGCSSGKSEQTADQEGMPTGPGVTDSSIKLGIDTVLTGPFAAQGKAMVQGLELFWDEKNADGGVCDRKVELVSRDQGYDVQKAVAAYTEIKDDVLGMALLSGSPATTALLPNLQQDEMLTLTSSYAENVLESEYIIMPGTPYGLEMISGLDYLMEEGVVNEGDTVGYIWQQGAYGEAGLAGAKFAAEQHGLTLVDQQITAADEDMRSAVSAIEAKNATAVLMSGSSGQTANAASAAAAMGYDAPILSSNPGFAPSLLETTAKDPLEEKLLLATSVAPYSAPAMDGLREAFQDEFPNEPPNMFVVFGYGAGQVYAEVLQAACDEEDLTRAGLLEAYQGLGEVDTGGAFVPLDFSGDENGPASSQIYILRPSESEEAGLELVSEAFQGETAAEYGG